MTAAKATRGQKLVASIRAGMTELGCTPTSTEAELLRLASSLADRLEELEKIIKRDGLIITTRRGDDPKTNPAAVEARAVSTNLARTLGGIYIGDSTTGPRKDPKKQRGARRRWDRAAERAAHGAA